MKNNKIYELVYGIAQYVVLDKKKRIKLLYLAIIINLVSLLSGNMKIYYGMNPCKEQGMRKVVDEAYAYAVQKYGQTEADVIRQAFKYRSGKPVIP